jgi:hypothetical protein
MNFAGRMSELRNTTAVILPCHKEWAEREFREWHYMYILRERDPLNDTVTDGSGRYAYWKIIRKRGEK